MQSWWNKGRLGGGGGCIRSQIASLSKSDKRKLVGPVSSQATVARYHLTGEVCIHMTTFPNYTGKVTFRRVRVTTVALKKCACSLSYPACETYAPYFHLWTVWLYHIFFFPDYRQKGKIFGNVNQYEMCIFMSSTTVV
jgi:hypothetical protein